MENAKAQINFGGKSEAYIIERVTAVLARMTGNPAYAAPEPSLIVVRAKLEKLIKDTAAASKGGSDRIFTRGLSRKDMVETMAGLIGYVQHTSGGDALKILDAGMDVEMPRKRAGMLSPPDNIRSRFGVHKGEIKLIWGGVINSKVYIIQVNDTPGDDSKWVNLTVSTKNSLMVTGLISRKLYTFRIASFNNTGSSAWSEITQHEAL